MYSNINVNNSGQVLIYILVSDASYLGEAFIVKKKNNNSLGVKIQVEHHL